MRTSVIIPAFNEAASIGRTLGALVRAPDSGNDIEVIVAANGCTDATVEIARSYGVGVVEVPTASKTAALNAADAVATAFPRIYWDADTLGSPALVRALAAEVSRPGILAAVPRMVVDTSASSWPVRAYYRVNSRLPVFAGRLFGRGVIALAEQGRARFGQFPEIIADDMFLDAVIDRAEKSEIDLAVPVRAPRRAGELVRRVARAREGNDEFWAWMAQIGRAQGLSVDPVPSSSRTSWLRDVVLPSPGLWPAAACYVGVVAMAERRRRSAGWTARSGWGRQVSNNR